MDKFTSLYDFIDFATANRKYATSTANNLKSALKIFEKELNAEELKSIGMVEDSIGEIFRSLVMANKDKSIVSLNTYKARLLKVIKDYKKYGVEPSKIQHWVAKPKKDKLDRKKIILSKSINRGVENYPCACLSADRDNYHKIELSLASGKAEMSIPKNISAKDAKIIQGILTSLSTE